MGVLRALGLNTFEDDEVQGERSQDDQDDDEEYEGEDDCEEDQIV